MATAEDLPTYEEFGREVLAGVDRLDSLELVEVAMMAEDGGAGRDMDELLATIADMPERVRRMTVLGMLLAGGMEFRTTMLGRTVVVQAVETDEPPRPPFESGVRVPRGPLPSEGADAIRLEIPVTA